MERIQRRRDALKRVVYNLKKKIKGLIEKEITNEVRQEITASKTLMKEKVQHLRELQDQILNELEPDEVGTKMDKHTKFELNIRIFEEELKTLLDVKTLSPVECLSETSSREKNRHETQMFDCQN